MEPKVTIDDTTDECTLVCSRQQFKALGCAALLFNRVHTHCEDPEEIYASLVGLNTEEVAWTRDCLKMVALAVRRESNLLRARGVNLDDVI